MKYLFSGWRIGVLDLSSLTTRLQHTRVGQSSLFRPNSFWRQNTENSFFFFNYGTRWSISIFWIWWSIWIRDFTYPNLHLLLFSLLFIDCFSMVYALFISPPPTLILFVVLSVISFFIVDFLSLTIEILV